MKQFTVFVDDMDGDVVEGTARAADVVKHALDNGAIKVVVKEWPEKEKRGRRFQRGDED